MKMDKAFFYSRKQYKYMEKNSTIIRVMRLTFVFLFVSIGFAFAADSYAQSTFISMNVSGRTVAEVLETIENETEFNFYYNSKLVDTNRRVSVRVKNKHVYAVLDQLFSGQDVAYKVMDKDIILTTTQRVGTSGVDGVSQNRVAVSGTVTDATGEPVPGANIVEKGTANGTITDIDGKFAFSVAPGATLEVSFIGYMKKEVPIGGNTRFNITLEEDRKTLEEVVVVGYGTQKKVNLTGSVSSVKGGELAKRPVMSTVQALQPASPSHPIPGSPVRKANPFGSEVSARSTTTTRLCWSMAWSTRSIPLPPTTLRAFPSLRMPPRPPFTGRVLPTASF